MDKKKVKELIGQTIDFVENKYLLDALATLRLVEVELSKSDWVSVEDGLPEYGEEVLVCNKKVPDSIYITYRTDKEKSREVIDNNKFYYERCLKPITHWKHIEKLDKIK